MGSSATMSPVFYCALFVAVFTAANAVSVHRDEETRGSCPDGWLDTGLFGGTMGCLLFNSSKSYNWDKANEYCYKEGGELVEIILRQEMEFLISYLKQLETHEAKQNWWAAGTDAGREGRWLWPSSLTNVESYVWYPSYPNNGAVYNCLLLYHPYSYQGIDYPCANTYMPICQKK